MLNRLRNYWSIFTSRFSSPQGKKFLTITAIAAVALAIPLTVFIAQKQQETRQRAAEFEVTPPFITLPYAKESLAPEENTVKYLYYGCKTDISRFNDSNVNGTTLLLKPIEGADFYDVEWRKIFTKDQWNKEVKVNPSPDFNKLGSQWWNDSIYPIESSSVGSGFLDQGVKLVGLDLKDYMYGVRVIAVLPKSVNCPTRSSEWSDINIFSF